LDKDKKYRVTKNWRNS